MSDYKRLTKQAGWHKDIDLKDELGYSYIYQRLAEWENDYESGKVVKLPCKVGDTAYCANYGDKGWRILKGYVNEINIDLNGIYIKCDYEYSLSFWHKPILGDVFFNIEDAKKRLKKLKELENGRN